jgi:N-acetylglucosamine-6-phosphate deacetylase
MRKKNMEGYVLENGIIITPFDTLKGRSVLIEGGIIKKIFKKNIELSNLENYKIIDVSDCYVCPGFIDIHTHGGGGQDCLGGDIEIISKFKLSQGITGYLPTLIAGPLESIYDSFDLLHDFMQRKDKHLPNILGVHIEGIYLNKKYKGAQPLQYLREPNAKECVEIIKKSKGLLKIMTLAPEIKNCPEVIEILTSHGVISSVGHSNATPADIDVAIEKGLSHATHSFNAMGEMGFEEPGVRSPGLEGYILVRDEIKLEIIGEKTHVNSVIMEIAFRCKKADNIIIVTDSMSVSGLPPGVYKIGVMELIVEKNADVARLQEGGLAGSIVPINKAIKTFYENTSASFNESVQMATYNPLKSLGLTVKKGTVEEGKDADLTIIDEEFNVNKVFVAGDLAYDKDI